MIKAGDIVQVKSELKPNGKYGTFGRLSFDKQYEVLRITKQGHLMLQTDRGKTHYSIKCFKLIQSI